MIKRFSAFIVAVTLLLSFAIPVSADYDDSPVFNVPAGFTTYEYIESDGVGYVLTDYYPTNNSGVWFDAQLLDNSAQASLFGSDEDDGAYDARYNFRFITAGTDGFQINKEGSTSTTVVVADNTARMYYSLTADNQYSIGEVSGTLTNTGVEFTSSIPCAIFAYNLGGTVSNPAKMRLYRFQFFDGDTIVRDYYPASNESGTYGLLDAVTGSFVPVSTTGTFSVGDIASTGGTSVADKINDLNEQIAGFETEIYDDLHEYSAQVDPSSVSIPTSFVSAISFISSTWVSAYEQLGDFQIVITFPLFLAIALLFIGRASTVIVTGAMKSRKNNDKQGGGDIG